MITVSYTHLDLYKRQICSFIDYHRTLAFEELVHIEVGLCVNGVSQKLGDKATFHFPHFNTGITH